MYPAYAITLQSSSPQPRFRVSADMYQQLSASATLHKWSVTATPAVDGFVLNRDHWSNNGFFISTTAGKFMAKPGAWGCFLSHYQLWQLCVSVDQPMIILEHDAVITAPWPQQLTAGDHLIKLHTATKTKHKNTVGHWATGAWAYLLTPHHAHCLISGVARVGVMAVDKLIGTAIVPWKNLDHDLVEHNTRPHFSTVSSRTG